MALYGSSPVRAGSCWTPAVVLAAILLASGPALAAPQGAQPTVDFTAGSQSGPEDSGTLTVTVQLSATSASNVDVPFTLSGTAALTDDFSASASPVTILAGNLTADVTLTLVDDLLDEADETIVLTMGTPSGADAGTTTVHTATVTDDDATPTVDFDAASQSVDEFAGTALVTLNLSAASGLEVTVPYGLSGTATEVDDFTTSATEFVIPAGQTSADVTLTLADDLLDEADETIVLSMGVPVNADAGTTTVHTATVTDDDATPTVDFDAATQIVDEFAGTALVTVNLSAASGLEVTVPYGLSGTATEVDDFTASATEFVIPAGQTSADVTLTLADDLLDEADETVVLTMGTPVGADAGTTTVHTATVTDDDATPTVDFDAATQIVDEFAGTALVTVNLSAASGLEVTVPYGLSGTATEVDDFTASATEFVIPAGQVFADVTLTLVDDPSDETDETIVLTMGLPVNADAGTVTVHTATVTDDDPLPSVDFALATDTAGEATGQVLVTAQLSEISAFEVTVPFTVAGTAVDPDDYTLAATEFVIAAGELSADVAITLVDNALFEADETVELSLGAPTNGVLGSVVVYTLTIQDDESAPTVQFDAPTQSFGESDGSGLATVVLSSASSLDVTVPFTLSGTAALTADFTVAANEFSVPAGQTSATVAITLSSDALDELDETIELTLGTPENATLGAQVTHIATILDDDPQPTASFALLRQEVDESAGVVAVQVNLSAVSGREVTVDFAAGGAADDPQDYTLASSPLIIPEGSSGAGLLVTIIDDFVASEGPENVILSLGNPSGAVLHPFLFRHGLTILDNDSPTWNPIVRGLAASVASIDFDATRVDDLSSSTIVFVGNQQAGPISFDGIQALGQNPDEFTVVYSQPPPVILQPGQFTSFQAYLAPLEGGEKRARLMIQQTPHASPRTRIPVRGTAYGLTGEEIRANAGLDAYIDTDLEVWIPDYGMTGDSVVFAVVQQIQGTDEDGLYQAQRAGDAFSYEFDLPNGTYDVTLSFAEIIFDADGARVFDVLIEGVPEVAALDIRATAGFLTAHQEIVRTVVSDGQLNIDLFASVGEAAIAAIDVHSMPLVSPDVTLLDFGTVGQGAFVDLPILLTNDGLHGGVIDKITFDLPTGGHISGHDFSILIDGQAYYGDHSTVTYPVSIPVAAGGSVPATVTFEPTEEEVNVLTLRIEGNFDPIDVGLAGTGDHNIDWGFLHPVITTVPELVVDYDGDLREFVDLFGNESHTHETGVELIEWEWTANSVSFSTDTDTTGDFPLGDTPITLTIRDDDTPQGEATDGRTISVYKADQVPGILEQFYVGGGQSLVTLLDNLPTSIDFIDRIDNLQTLAVEGRVGESPYTGDVVVQWVAEFGVGQVADYEFTLTGGLDSRLYVDGQLVTGPLTSLALGKHDLDARFAVANLFDLPLFLSASINGEVDGQFAASLTHDELGIVPVIHAMPTGGSELGGDLITIQGFGFYPKDQVTVKWGLGATLTEAEFLSYGAEQLEFFSPPGTGTVPVSIETPAGESNFIAYNYSPNTVPIKFIRLDDEFVQVTRVTTGDWGPDGRFYVGTLDGEIKAITFDENYHATDVATYVGVDNLTNSDILGIAFNPFDPPSPVKLYVGHAELYQHGGGAFSGPSDYVGQVSVLTGPNFDNPVPLITQLPVSNHDHGINGMMFDNNGDLLICIGGNTNAGVQWPQIGDLPESPLSGAIVKAETSRPDFNGALSYVETATQIVNNDQVFGEIVDVAPGTHVTVHAPGLRNSYDLLLATNNYLYATDNGPNNNFGPASTGPTSDSGNHPNTEDELVLVEFGNYYGAANRNRGRYFPRENIWRDDVEPSIPDVFTQMIEDFDSSSDGITEYRASAFNSQMRGQLIVQKYNGSPRRVELTPDGRGVVTDLNISPQIKGLDVVTGPGGAILTCEYQQSSGFVKMLVPDDPSALVGVKIYDIFPWRAPSTGGAPFVIGGEGFGTLANTSVMIGGLPASLTSVSSKRIRGIIPSNPTWTTGFLPVEVFVGLDKDSLPQGFRYLGPTPSLEPGFWKTGASMPDDVGEVACGVIDGIMYLVGQGSNKTFAYDILNDTWADNLDVRPFSGHHHSAEVIDGKLYLIGRLGGGGGKVQIYDPVLDNWTEGDPMPWNAGSVQTSVIDGKLYAAGGIVGSSTVANVWRYDPVIDQWDASPLADIPTPVNHAAAATDGSLFYIFGGRAGPNQVQPGFDVVQIYDPVTDVWDSSDLGGSTLAPMPNGRGGTGRAVWYQDEFYVFGGETNDSGDVLADPGNVFPQVYVYDPAANSWREELRMPTARHGIYPVLFQSRIYVAGGGVVSASSQSDILEIFTRQ